MITIRRAAERHHDRSRQRAMWRTFYPQERPGDLGNGFGTLEFLDESRLAPGGAVLRRAPHDAEIVTFVREGALAWEDSNGGSGLVQAGEFRRMTAGRRIRHREANASRTHGAHIFQIWLRPAEAELEPSHEQRRFNAADRRGRLCVVGSPDGRRASLSIHQDALVFSALLDPGTHVAHELLPGRSVWLHIVLGEATLGEVVLGAGDGAGISSELAVSLTALQETELLLLDLGRSSPTFTAEGSHGDLRRGSPVMTGVTNSRSLVDPTTNQCKRESTMNVRPLHDRVLVRHIDTGEQVRGGILIPDSAREKPQEAEVFAVGPGKINDDGSRSPMDVDKGDRILVGRYSGSEIKIDDEEYLILREDEILAVVAG